MDLIVTADGMLNCGKRNYSCALGRSGIFTMKQEGDGATPSGRYALREIFYRPDRTAKPAAGLPVREITPDLGWCDDPDHPDYNRLIPLPHPARHEVLWRDDGLYDLLAVIGYNDRPPRPGLGSAIFLHVAAADGAPTEGCVALALADLTDLLTGLTADAWIDIRPPGGA